MRWDLLFDDLEAQLGTGDARERDAEVADRTRRERALLDLQARLLAQIGPGAAPLGVVLGPHELVGRLLDVGPDWALLETRPGREVLVCLTAVRAVRGAGPGARLPSVVARRFTLGAALRAVSRDRAPVELTDVDGRARTGTVDVVGADHLDLAEHPGDEVRRPGNVTGTVLVPFSAIASVRRL